MKAGAAMPRPEGDSHIALLILCLCVLAVLGHAAKRLVSSPSVLNVLPAEGEIGDRSDAHVVRERHGAPQPLATADLLRWAAVDVRKRRRKQRELDDPPEYEGGCHRLSGHRYIASPYNVVETRSSSK